MNGKLIKSFSNICIAFFLAEEEIPDVLSYDEVCNIESDKIANNKAKGKGKSSDKKCPYTLGTEIITEIVAIFESIRGKKMSMFLSLMEKISESVGDHKIHKKSDITAMFENYFSIYENKAANVAKLSVDFIIYISAEEADRFKFDDGHIKRSSMMRMMANQFPEFKASLIKINEKRTIAEKVKRREALEKKKPESDLYSDFDSIIAKKKQKKESEEDAPKTKLKPKPKSRAPQDFEGDFEDDIDS